MKNIVISWVAWQNDFKNGQVSDESPNMDMHRYFFDDEAHKKHVLLSSGVEEDTRTNMLKAAITHSFPQREIEVHYLDIQDAIDLQEVKPKMENVVIKYRSQPVDIFFSPGTSIIQLSWFLIHQQGIAKSRIFQGRKKTFTSTGKPDFFETTFEVSKEAHNIQIRNIASNDESDFLITPSLKPVFRRADNVAAVDKVPVVISGDTGTGKEYLAKYIHKHSARHNKPFVAVNCASLTSTLLESRLFGHSAGAFTGATQARKGFFEEAEGGTLFLDEIGEIDTFLQKSLLRVLQEEEFIRVGETQPRKTNVRIIAATNKDLEELCVKGKFRWDLFYRLQTTNLHIPALTERGISEANMLLEHFIKQKAKKYALNPLKLTEEARRILLDYPYPGNVRELENFTEQLYVHAGENVNKEDLPSRLLFPRPEFTFSMQAIEKQHIQKVLTYFEGNKSRTARALGFGSLNTLNKKMELYGLK